MIPCDGQSGCSILTRSLEKMKKDKRFVQLPYKRVWGCKMIFLWSPSCFWTLSFFKSFHDENPKGQRFRYSIYLKVKSLLGRHLGKRRLILTLVPPSKGGHKVIMEKRGSWEDTPAHLLSPHCLAQVGRCDQKWLRCRDEDQLWNLQCNPRPLMWAHPSFPYCTSTAKKIREDSRNQESRGEHC